MHSPSTTPALHVAIIRNVVFAIACFVIVSSSMAQGTRLLRQPTLSATQVAFTYGGDVWTADLNGQNVKRITSTAAVESNPHFSPDGKWIAFSSNRSGNTAVYVVSIEGGTPKRLTWHPSASIARGWTPDGKHILYATSRNSAPTGFDRLWTVSVDGGPLLLETIMSSCSAAKCV